MRVFRPPRVHRNAMLVLAVSCVTAFVWDGPVPGGAERRRAYLGIDDNYEIASHVFTQYVDCTMPPWSWADLDSRYLAVYMFSTQSILMNTRHTQKLNGIMGYYVFLHEFGHHCGLATGPQPDA